MSTYCSSSLVSVALIEGLTSYWGKSNTYYEEFLQIIMRTILKFLLEGLEKENLRKNYWRAHSYVSADYGMPFLLMRIFTIYSK